MKSIFFVLFGLVAVQVWSQNYFNLGQLSYTNTPQNKFDSGRGQTQVEELALQFEIPIVINERTTLLAGFFTNQTAVKLDPHNPETKLKVLGLGLGVHKTFNPTWSATFMGFPKIASDVITLSGNNTQFAFLTLISQTKQANLKYRYGIYANTEKYGLIIVPILGLYYLSPNSRLDANLNLPILADINYLLRKNLWLGIKFDGLGTTYYLNNQAYSPSGAYVSKISNEISTYLRFALTKSLYFNTKIGYALGRSYDVYQANDKVDLNLIAFYFGDNRTRLNERFKDGAIFKVELLYRLHF